MQLKAQVTAKDVQLTATRVAVARSAKLMDVMTRAHASMRSELDALDAAGERREAVLRDFVEDVLTGYSELMRTHTISNRSRLNTRLSDTQSRGEYVGGYRISVREDCYSLSIDEATSGVERGDHTSTTRSGDDDIFEAVAPFSNLPPAAS